MQLFSAWPERQAHLTRWVLLLGWLGLIVSLLIPDVDPWPFDINHCGALLDCHTHEGNQIFWGLVVPSGLLILVVLSHEVWRRICPLAFISQVFRALHWQRTVPGKGGRREVVKVEANSWLGQHHVQLQWTLFIAGLSLRLLVVNSSTLGLGLLLLTTLAAALVVGWAYGGKAWCQYVCPMAPVQTIVTGQRSLLGSPAHMDTSSKITQSMCRTYGEKGKLQSACVACQAPCIDIDSERAYWQTFSGKRGLDWAWFSYPGLVLGFFLLIRAESREGVDYLRTGLWAYDARHVDAILQPLQLWGLNTLLPRLLSLPALLVLAGAVSVALFSWLQRQLERRLVAFGERAGERALQRTRLLATVLAVNIFFWFADPSLGALGGKGGQLIRSVVLIASGMWLYRGWSRDKATYTRESTSASLRKQLEKLVPELDAVLEGRSLQELSANEVFTLAKVLPVQISATKRGIYREVMSDLFDSGRLDRAAALVQLEELRQSLGLVEEDHHVAVRELAITDPRILQLDYRQREIRSLRQEAAAEAIEDLLEASRTLDLSAALASPSHQEGLERIRSDFVLDEASWGELLARFGPTSAYSTQRLEEEWEELRAQLAARASLELAAATDPLIRPLLPVIDRRLTSLFVVIWPSLSPFGDDDPLVQRFAALLPLAPPSVLSQLRRREERLLLEAGHAAGSLDPLPEPAEALEALWLDPDPDTALWVLWVQDRRAPVRAAALRRQPRVGLPDSPALRQLLAGVDVPHSERLTQLLQVPLGADLSPAALFSMLRWGDQRRLEPGEVLFGVGDQPDIVAILLEGRCEVYRDDGVGNPMALMAQIRVGEPIGEVAFFTDHPRRAQVRAGAEPATVLVFTASHFEELLAQSTEFSRSLLQQLSLRLEDLYAKVGPASVSR
ncbi:cyclic nucleotide-binding domain-containing protein [Cyanobium sp. Morenito 9A2]|uniref:cyclic nucleotide-binding domain-containing protein n=1 Tax=Cyanobium sp. Morenito 9A2 TaxID=2823718 RepID=UPI0020CE3027|nr:cyclic nucleotide-binding domain-containing protein [Cyanobium sp. Morenito 9A2]MCP9850038.1 cyclic nucleotide-binding domain-containing protein [Cyanobium sp. Morenito 9A2]